MNDELKKLLANQRKYKREILELKELKIKVLSHKNPDPKTVKMIDEELAKYMNGGTV